MIFIVLCILSSFLIDGTASPVTYNRENEGYSDGYLSDCPGSTWEAIISPRSLKRLTLTVVGTGLMPRKAVYNYYQVNQLANDPDIDFRNKYDKWGLRTTDFHTDEDAGNRKKTFLYVGGYLDSPVFPLAFALATKYKRHGYNVLLLDTNPFTTTYYPRAARLMRPIGKHAAKMLANLTDLGLNPKDLELVGLSLGGQTMSFIAKNYREITGRNVSRLTGLDPSGPCFRHLGPDERLDKTDADFVDVIATNIDGFGMATPVGHVNFYVNGGEYQNADFYTIPCTVLCSHIRSYFLWLAAVENPNSFIGMQCDSVQQARDRNCYDRQPLVTNVVGLNTDKSKEGIFYLATNNNFPYYLGKKGLKRENDAYISYLKSLNAEKVIKV